jgi:pimeloyl-ACP methyl ester carboxylesterase
VTTVRAGGVDLAVRDEGQGFPVLLLHGFTGSKEDWHYATAPLAEGFRVISYDHRGHGRSSKPEGRQQYSLAALTADLAALVDELGLDRFHLVAHSMGGVVAQMYLTERADRVARAVLVDSTPVGVGRPSPLEERISRVERDGLMADYDSSPPHPALAAMPELAAFLRDRFIGMSPDAFVALGNALLDLPDLRPSLAGLDLPLLVICGEGDTTLPPELSRSLAAAVGGARYAEIAHAGHTPQVENLPAFLDAVVPFLDGA